NWPWFRRQLSNTANQLACCLLGARIRDWTSGYRCYRRRVLAALALEGIRSNGYSFLVEILAACVRHGWCITEVPITFTDRRSGRSKLSGLEIYKGVFTLLRLGVKRAFSGVPVSHRPIAETRDVLQMDLTQPEHLQDRAAPGQ